MFDSHPKVFDCVCRIVPTRKHKEKNLSQSIRVNTNPHVCFFAFAGSQELHDIKIQQVREAEAQATNNT
jgi:hypothetical protein